MRTRTGTRKEKSLAVSVEGQAKDLDKEVDGVAGEISWRPTPVAVFDEFREVKGKGEDGADGTSTALTSQLLLESNDTASAQ